MEKAKKVTKREYFAQLREVVKDNAELVAFIDHEVELLDRKNSKTSQTKGQKINEQINEVLVQELAKVGTPITISDLLEKSEVLKEFTYNEGEEVKHLSNQKISALLNRLTNGENARVVKVIDKKKSYFSIAD